MKKPVYIPLTSGILIGYFATNIFKIPLPGEYFWYTFFGFAVIFLWMWLSWRRLNEDVRE